VLPSALSSLLNHRFNPQHRDDARATRSRVVIELSESQGADAARRGVATARMDCDRPRIGG